jgi:hypothetical protein
MNTSENCEETIAIENVSKVRTKIPTEPHNYNSVQHGTNENFEDSSRKQDELSFVRHGNHLSP